MYDQERERLHVDSVKLLAMELGNIEKDPTGTMLEARERRYVRMGEEM